MANKKRKAIPADQQSALKKVEAVEPQHVNVEPQAEEVKVEKSLKYFIPIAKANEEKKTVTGVALVPEVTDAQGQIVSEEVIEDTAHKFLAGYNVNTKLGLMHKDFKPRFQLYESYIAPQPLIIGDKAIKKGSWVVVVKVLDSKVWKLVKKGKITGFSIGGTAKVLKLNSD